MSETKEVSFFVTVSPWYNFCSKKNTVTLKECVTATALL